MTDSNPHEPVPVPPEERAAEPIIDSAGRELTKPAGRLIVPATIVAIAACALFLYVTRDDAGEPVDDGTTAEQVDLTKQVDTEEVELLDEEVEVDSAAE